MVPGLQVEVMVGNTVIGLRSLLFSQKWAHNVCGDYLNRRDC